MQTLDKKQSVVILMGPPGSGKGTHANPLSLHLKLPHISTGDLFRSLIRNQAPLGVVAKSYIDKGQLVPDDLVLEMLFSRVSMPDCENGYILDGFPRTITQGIKLDAYLKDRAKVIVLNFNLEDSLIVERVTGRIICKNCSRPFHKVFQKPKIEMVCDDCQGSLYQRDDDSKEVVLKRLEVYRNQTKALIEFYENQNDTLIQIDSKQEKDKVFQDVLNLFETDLQKT